MLCKFIRRHCLRTLSLCVFIPMIYVILNKECEHETDSIKEVVFFEDTRRTLNTTVNDGIVSEYPVYEFMNVSDLISVYNDSIPRELYYTRQKTAVNSWNCPVLYHNASLCAGPADIVFLLILVISSPSQRATRDDVRMTWGGELANINDVRINFVVGKPSDKSSEAALYIEAYEKKDIIFLNFTESYEILSVKSLLAFNWANKYCANAKFFLKIDHDMIVNGQALFDNIRNHYKTGAHDFVGHNVGHKHTKIHREGQWALPLEQYPYQRFPHYLSGPFYALSSFALKNVVETSKYVPLIRLEDVYVTGILREIIGRNITEDNGWMAYWSEKDGAYTRLFNGMTFGLHYGLNSTEKIEVQRKIERARLDPI